MLEIILEIKMRLNKIGVQQGQLKKARLNSSILNYFRFSKIYKRFPSFHFRQLSRRMGLIILYVKKRVKSEVFQFKLQRYIIPRDGTNFYGPCKYMVIQSKNTVAGGSTVES